MTRYHVVLPVLNEDGTVRVETKDMGFGPTTTAPIVAEATKAAEELKRILREDAKHGHLWRICNRR